jgi:hypothetical protein
MEGLRTMTKLYFKNEKTGRKYEIIKLDKEKSQVTLRGDYAEFVEPYDKERFKKLGYTLVKEEETDGRNA